MLQYQQKKTALRKNFGFNKYIFAGHLKISWAVRASNNWKKHLRITSISKSFGNEKQFIAFAQTFLTYYF